MKDFYSKANVAIVEFKCIAEGPKGPALTITESNVMYILEAIRAEVEGYKHPRWQGLDILLDAIGSGGTVEVSPGDSRFANNVSNLNEILRKFDWELSCEVTGSRAKRINAIYALQEVK